VSLMAKKLVGVGVGTAVLGVLIALYVAGWATSFPRSVAASSSSTTAGVSADLTLQTVAAVGPKYSPTHPDWVSYLIKSNGKWIHSTDFRVPANSLVHVTILQYDGDSGLRNPFLSEVPGNDGQDRDGRRQDDRLDQPRRSVTHLRGAGTRHPRAAAGRRRRSQEPV
jgi:hypothetical protein